MKRALVCYASLTGFTAEVAEAVADVLRQSGAEVTVKQARDVREADLAQHSAVVLGTAIRMGKVLKEAVDLVQRHAAALQPLPTAYFTVGLRMRDGTPEGRAETESYLVPLRALKEPAAAGFFLGSLDYKKLAPPLRFLLSRSRDVMMREGDWRDWDAIRSWARELPAALFGGDSPA